MSLPEDLFARYAGIMSEYGRPWAMCGGWAVDAWLGRTTREHGDFDLSLFECDLDRLSEHFADWYLIAHDAAMVGNSTELWDGGPLKLPAHFHARPAAGGGYEKIMQWVTTPFSSTKDGLDFDIQVNERDGEDWVLSRDPYVAVPMTKATQELRAGLTVATPEVLIYYKATAYWGREGYPREHDLVDSRALLPLVSPEALHWLRESVGTVVPGHPWLGQLLE